MARRRTFYERPHDALRRATEAHARLTSGAPATTPADEAPPPVAEDADAEHHAKTQHRDEGGKFA